MTVYMVFEPPRRGDDPLVHAERIAFVRDRFSWPAFLFAPLWLLWYRLWLALAIYVVALAALATGLRLLGASLEARSLAVALLGVLLGLEAATVRRRKLLHHGWRERGIVVGDDREAAERRFFDHSVTAETTNKMEAALEARPPPPGAADVVGLFPQPGAQTGAQT
jgi:thiol:disulfide interchange protein